MQPFVREGGEESFCGVVAVTAGEELERLYKDYYCQILLVVQKRLGSFDAEDITSGIFLDVCEEVLSSRFKNHCALPTFLFVITQRRIADVLRERYKQRRVWARELLRLHGTDSPFRSGGGDERAGKAVFSALEYQSCRDRGIILDYFEVGMTKEELACKYRLSKKRIAGILYAFLKFVRRRERNVTDNVEGACGGNSPEGVNNSG